MMDAKDKRFEKFKDMTREQVLEYASMKAIEATQILKDSEKEEFLHSVTQYPLTELL
jgi:hypothetical protein